MLCKCKFSTNYSEKILMTLLITEDIQFIIIFIIIICSKLHHPTALITIFNSFERWCKCNRNLLNYMNVKENYSNDGYCHINQMHIAQTAKEYMCDSKEKEKNYGLCLMKS